MWKYNNADELYHYGVIGMRWGHRKNPEVASSYKAYKKSKKEYRKEKRKNLKNIFKKSNYAAGVENSKEYDKNHKNINKAINKREKAAFKLIDSAAKDAYNKKLSKTGSKSKAEKASMKVHYKAFKKTQYGAGRVGSVADYEKHHGVRYGNEHYYNHLVKEKGKKYASAIEKKYNKRTVKQLAAGTAILGYGIYQGYRNS